MIQNIIFKGALSLAMATLPIMNTTTTDFNRLVNAPDTRPVQDQTDHDSAVSAAPPARPEAVKTYRLTVTAFSSTPDQTDDTPFTTANGTHVHDGTLAANFLPFGARVRLPEIYGDKIFTVEDRMNARYKLRADVWMASRKEAINFGLQRNVLLEVLPPEDQLIAKAD